MASATIRTTSLQPPIFASKSITINNNMLVRSICGVIIHDNQTGKLTIKCIGCHKELWDSIIEFALHLATHLTDNDGSSTTADPANNPAPVDNSSSIPRRNRVLPSTPIKTVSIKLEIDPLVDHVKPKTSTTIKLEPKCYNNTTESATNSNVQLQQQPKPQVKIEPAKKKRYNCTRCDASFEIQIDLKRHSNKHSYMRKHLKCDHCEKRFSLPSTLKMHINSKHIRTETYTCDICQKSFAFKGYMAIHMRYHTGEKPYQCQQCGLQFHTNGHYNSHLRMHAGTLRRYTCSVCGLRCINPKSLEEHMNAHDNIRPYKCTVCPKTFTCSKLLRSHSRLHTGIKPYKCKYCEKFFSQCSNRRLHEKQKHERRDDDDEYELAK